MIWNLGPVLDVDASSLPRPAAMTLGVGPLGRSGMFQNRVSPYLSRMSSKTGESDLGLPGGVAYGEERDSPRECIRRMNRSGSAVCGRPRREGPLGGVTGGPAAWLESSSCSELAPRDREGVEAWLGPRSISGMSVGGGWEGRIKGGSGRSDDSVELTVIAGESSPISGLSLDLDTDLDLCRPAEGYNADRNRSPSSCWNAMMALPASSTPNLTSG